jgi:ABC-type methionine transport system permease subunit
MATKPIIFRHQEPEVVRVPKFNKVAIMAALAMDGSGGGGGGAILAIDGGFADNSGIPYIEIEGGTA